MENWHLSKVYLDKQNSSHFFKVADDFLQIFTQLIPELFTCSMKGKYLMT